MAEIEFSVLSRSCLRQRVPDQETLGREVQALVRERNAARSIINWRFNTQNARTKLHRLYPFDSTIDSGCLWVCWVRVPWVACREMSTVFSWWAVSCEDPWG